MAKTKITIQEINKIILSNISNIPNFEAAIELKIEEMKQVYNN